MFGRWPNVTGLFAFRRYPVGTEHANEPIYLRFFLVLADTRADIALMPWQPTLKIKHLFYFSGYFSCLCS